MAKKPTSTEPLRGEAKWRAVKEDIAKRNEAAYARGREQRAAKDEQSRKHRVAQEKADRGSTPKPGASK